MIRVSTLPLVIGCGISTVAIPAYAQIIPDATLGPESSRVTVDNALPAAANSADIDDAVRLQQRIDGGAIRADFLFHSFEDFNIGDGDSAYFSNPDGVANILSRVTGANPSDLLGQLGVLGDANLFFLNPNGIVLGPNASLDIAGSFVATTADQFTFADGQIFSAINPTGAPLLNIQVPFGVQYGTGRSGSIINAADLTVNPGQNLTLTGETVVNTGTLTAAGGEVAIAALSNPSLVNLSPQGQILEITSLADLGGAGEGVASEEVASETGAGLVANAQSVLSDGQGQTVRQAPTVAELLNHSSANLGLTIVDGGPGGNPPSSASGRGPGNEQVAIAPSPTPIPTAPGDAIVSGQLDAADLDQGGSNSDAIGGRVRILGDRVALVDSANINVSGRLGGGTALIGGDYQGQGNLLNAQYTYVGPDAIIQADALETGDGGRAIVWADALTGFYGTISAQARGPYGNGGFAEVSGKRDLIFEGAVDLTALDGLTGTLLLDPENITILDGAGQTNDDQADDGEVLFADEVVTTTPGDPGTPPIMGTDPFGNPIIIDPGTPATPSTTTIDTNFKISENRLETLAGTTNVILQANANITIEDLSDNALTFAAGTGTISFEAGDLITMDDLNDAIITNGRELAISATDITLGRIDTTNGTSGGVTDLNAIGNLSVAQYTGAELNGVATDNIQFGAIDASAANQRGVSLITELGNIDITGDVTTSAENTAINAGDIELTAGGTITTQDLNALASIPAQFSGSGGDVTVTADASITTGDINAYSGGGQGGDIRIAAQGPGPVTTGDLNGFGINQGGAGRLDITTSEGDLNIGTVNLRRFQDTGVQLQPAGAVTFNINGDIQAGKLATGAVGPANEAVNAPDSPITIAATGDVTLTNATAPGFEGADNLSGPLTITTAGMITLDGALHNTSSLTANSDGAIRLEGDRILLTNSAQLAGTTSDGSDITLVAQEVTLSDGAQVSSVISDAAPTAIASDINVSAALLTLIGPDSGIFSQTDGAAPGGDILIHPNQGDVLTIDFQSGATLEASTSGTGQGGDIILGNLAITPNRLAEVNLLGSGRVVVVDEQNAGNEGNLEINARLFNLSPDVELLTDNILNEGEEVIRLDQQNVNLTNQRIVLSDENDASGGIIIQAEDSIILSGTVTENNQILPAGLFAENIDGNGGFITLSADEIVLSNGAQIDASTQNGDGGDISITGRILRIESDENTPFDTGIFAQVRSVSTANGIVGTTGNIFLGLAPDIDPPSPVDESINEPPSNGQPIIVPPPKGQPPNGQPIIVPPPNGQPPNVQPPNNGVLKVQPFETIILDGPRSFISARAEGAGSAGSISLATQRLDVVNNARITTENRDGNRSADIPPSIIETFGVEQLTIQSGGQITAETETGQAGQIVINGRNTPGSRDAIAPGMSPNSQPVQQLTIDGNTSQITARATGNGGDAGRVDINARVVTLSNGAELTAANRSSNRPNLITLTQVEELQILDGSQISVLTQTGRAGNIDINANRNSRPVETLEVNNGSLISAEAIGDRGQAGNIRINTRELLVQDRSQITVKTQDGLGGNIQLFGLNHAQVLDQGRITASTFQGEAGDIDIVTNALTIADGGSISVRGEAPGASVSSTSGQGSNTNRGNRVTNEVTNEVTNKIGGLAGNLTITSNSVVLDGGFLLATTGRNADQDDSGGNITLNLGQGEFIEDLNINGLSHIRNSLLLRDQTGVSQSLIAANASGAGVAAGQITINAADGSRITAGDGSVIAGDGFIIALSPVGDRGSDITTNADSGAGGIISINALGLLGIETRDRLSSDSEITSISMIDGSSGTITVNVADVDPSRGLLQLPAVLVTAPPLDTICNPRQSGAVGSAPSAQSEFIVTGRGGIPQRPDDMNLGQTAITPWVSRHVSTSSSLRSPQQSVTLPEAEPNAPSVRENPTEAQGWVTQADGSIDLLASPIQTTAQTTPQRSGQVPQGVCHS